MGSTRQLTTRSRSTVAEDGCGWGTEKMYVTKPTVCYSKSISLWVYENPQNPLMIMVTEPGIEFSPNKQKKDDVKATTRIITTGF
jgi:hypothetical protein